MQVRIFEQLAGIMTAALLFFGPVQAFDEGIDYRTLDQKQPTQTGEKVEVLGLFWYGCPHCYQLEPALDRWLARKPDYVEFQRMPAVLGNSWENHARAYFTAEILGVLERLHIPFFKALHDEKQHLFDEASIADWFAVRGVDREEFTRAFNSFIVDMKMRRSKQYGQRVGLDSVPSFIVNGKFLTSPSITAGNERMFQVLDLLTAREVGVTSSTAAEIGDTGAPDPEEQRQVAAPQVPVQEAVPGLAAGSVGNGVAE